MSELPVETRVDPSIRINCLGRLVALLAPHRSTLSLVLLLLLVLTAVNIVMPQLFAIVFDDVFGQQRWGLLWMVLPGMLGLYVLRNFLYYTSKTRAIRVGETICFGLRSRLFERLQQMSIQYHRRTNPGQLSSRVMNDSYVLQQFIHHEMPRFLLALLLFAGVVATMYAMNWRLAVACTVVLPFHLVTFHVFRRPITRTSRSAQEHQAVASGNLVEKFLGIEVVKSFTAEDRENIAHLNIERLMAEVDQA